MKQLSFVNNSYLAPNQRRDDVYFHPGSNPAPLCLIIAFLVVQKVDKTCEDDKLGSPQAGGGAGLALTGIADTDAQGAVPEHNPG